MADLRAFLAFLKEKFPEDVVTIPDAADPDFEVTAINRELEKALNPLVIFPEVRGLSSSGFRHFLLVAKRCSREQVEQIILRLKAEEITILLVEQNANMALEVAEYAYVLETGA